MTHFSQRLILSARIGVTDPPHSGRGPEFLPDIDIPYISIFSKIAEGRGALWAE
jgi:hypothetical protein